MKYYLAVDIGASSGRHIIGWKEDDQIKTKEVFRFPNGVKEENGHLVWDINALYNAVKEGIDCALKEFPQIESISIDTWGVDYVLLDGDKEILPVYSYRDNRTNQVIPEVHNIIPFDNLYSKTGCQFQIFNSIYQFYADKKAGRLQNATDYLMIPEYLIYKLTGTKLHEYTNATTMGMVNADSGEIDFSIVNALGLPQNLFTKLSKPGTLAGTYKGINVILCATHDTGSAVEGISVAENEIYISSGTWSLLGTKTPKPLTDKNSMKSNYSNEGGVGYNRYQKNIMGMWVFNNLKNELCPQKEFSLIEKEAEEDSFNRTVDINAPEFLSPSSMKEAFNKALGVIALSESSYFRCAFLSFAKSYNDAIQEMETNTGIKATKIYITGGGAKNKVLNKLTEKATNKQVIAIPIEATAIGNLKIQMEVSK